MKDKQRVFAFHWIACILFLVCQSQGKMTLFELQGSQIIPLHLFVLPPSKERWTTTACLGPQTTFIVGDRKGSIHVFKVGQESPIQTIWKAHNHLGVTFVEYRNNKLVSLGRNAIMKEFFYNNKTDCFQLLTRDKTPITWLASKFDDVVTAFSGNNFVLWDSKSRRNIFEYNCGGGHRSFDFRKNQDYCFAFVKDKAIHIHTGNWKRMAPRDILPSFHIKEINALKLINLKNNIISITGGEDTTMKISVISKCTDEKMLKTICNFKSHLSSIRSIFIHKLSEDENKYLIFTAGGRAQLILWYLEIISEDDNLKHIHCAEHYVFHEELQQEEAEMRIMDICGAYIHSDLNIFAACSDGNVKVFVISQRENGTYHLEHIKSIFYKLKCILKVKIIKYEGVYILVTMATDGLLVFWRITKSSNTEDDYKILTTIKSHQSGINSCDCIFSSGFCHILTGGDDNAIVLTTVNIKTNGIVQIECIAQWMDTSTHCTQITGVFISDKYLITTAVDQRLTVFEWTYDSEKLNCRLLHSYRSTITDVQGMQCFQEDGRLNAFLHGRGLEFVQILNNL